MLRPEQVDTAVWLFIYGGIAVLGLGLFVIPVEATLGWAIAPIGLLLIGIGAVLLWLRSRMKPPP